MNYKKQRKLAVKLFTGKLPKKIVKQIADDTHCFEEIFAILKPYRNLVFSIIEDVKIPSEWAYYWAKDIGDEKVMIGRITTSKWACYWAKDIGDRKVMTNRFASLKGIACGL